MRNPNQDDIEKTAEIAHEVNRSYCESIYDNTQQPWSEAPQWQKDSAIAGVKAVIANPNLTPEQSHEGWMKQKLEDGWKFGKMKNPEKKEHPCLVKYEFLGQAQRTKDHLFIGTVKAILKVAMRD